MYQRDTARYAKALGYMKEIINSPEYDLVDDYSTIAVELPKPVRVEGTQHTHLRGPGSDVGIGCIVDAALDVLENVVAALDSALK